MMIKYYKIVVFALGDGRSPCRTRRNREDRDDERFGPSARHDGLRIQLLRTNGLQILRKHLQGLNL